MKKLILFGSAALLTGALVFTACKKDDDIVLPPIGGFNNSNEVGAADLVAHFPLEDGKERISNSAPAESKNATYVTGLKGNCVNLAAGYVAYNPIAALSANTASYSMSAWVSVKNNKTAPTMVASITRPSEWAGNFNMLCETGWYEATNDTLVVKGLLISKEGNPAVDSWQDSRNDPPKDSTQAFKGAGDTKWSHVVISWDAASSKFLVYANGKKVSNPEWEDRKHDGNPMGDLVFNPGPTRMLIGAFNTNTPNNGTPDAWQTPMTGKVDEVRVWKKALSAAEIDALYQLEKAGR